MGIFDSIKSSLRSLLGRDEAPSTDSSRRETRVSVERDTRDRRSEVDAESESAVKEPVSEETAASASTDTLVDEEEGREPAEAVESVENDRDAESVIQEAEPSDAETDEADGAVSAESDATASTDSMVDEERDDAEAAEPAEAVGAATTADAGVESDAESARDDAADDIGDPQSEDADAPAGIDADADIDAGDAPASANAEPVDNVKGIGPAYAERLADAGIETVADLAGADAVDLAEKIEVSEKRVQRWIDRAADYDA